MSVTEPRAKTFRKPSRARSGRVKWSAKSLPINLSRGTPVTVTAAAFTSVIFPSASIVSSGSWLASIRLRAYPEACFRAVTSRHAMTRPSPSLAARTSYQFVAKLASGTAASFASVTPVSATCR